MGRHCRQLSVTLRIGSLEEGSTSLDHEATWLLGHTETVTFGELWHGEGDLYVDAMLHVPCRYLAADKQGARCTAHGFAGSPPRPEAARARQPRRLGGDRFRLVDDMRSATRNLPAPPVPRALPVLHGENPCATAPCRTSDHRRGAACCRDLQIEIMCTRKERRLEALVRSRRSPYLCKVTRPGDFSIELGHPGNYDHADVAGPMLEILALCKKHRIPFGTTAEPPPTPEAMGSSLIS